MKVCRSFKWLHRCLVKLHHTSTQNEDEQSHRDRGLVARDPSRNTSHAGRTTRFITLEQVCSRDPIKNIPPNPFPAGVDRDGC